MRKCKLHWKRISGSAIPQFNVSKFAAVTKLHAPEIRVYRCMHSTHAVHRCWMETLTNKGVSCFLHESNKCRRYYVKKDKNVCRRCTNKAYKARIETRDRTVKEFGFYCHVETIVNASAAVLRIREKRQNMERQLLPMELNPIMDI